MRLPGIEVNDVSVARRISPGASPPCGDGDRHRRHRRHERSARGRGSSRDARRTGKLHFSHHRRWRRGDSSRARQARRSRECRGRDRNCRHGRRALPSVVRGGLVSAPVIAVPTSTSDTGRRFRASHPLLTMLNSCAAGVTVVNIDNGFGAAVAASRITHA